MMRGGEDAVIRSQPSEDSPADEPREAPAPEGRTLGLLGLLIELVLPVALSAAFLLAMASYTRYWDLHTPFGLAAFGALLVVSSLFVSLRVDGYTLRRREERGSRQLLNRTDPGSRLVKLVLGGVVIPVAVFATANLVELRNHQTPMTMAIRFRLARPEVDRPEQLADAVLRAESAASKVQGILALQATGSPESLDQLLRILSDDPAPLKNGSEYLAFARQTAADDAWADPVRGQALLLIAKLGGEEDLAALYGYLESPSAVLQARAMQAIAALQSRLSAGGGNG